MLEILIFFYIGHKWGIFSFKCCIFEKKIRLDEKFSTAESLCGSQLLLASPAMKSPYMHSDGNVKSFYRVTRLIYKAALISVSLALSQTPVYTARPRIIASRGVLVYAPAFVGILSGHPTEGWPG